MTFLELESHLINKLREILPPEIRIYPSPSIEFSVNSLAEFCPAVHVIYEGYTIKNTTSIGLGTVYSQNWLVLIAVKNVRGLESGHPAREEASAIIDTVIQNLNGYQPPNHQLGRLMPINSRQSAFGAGYMFFPFSYQCDLPINSLIKE